MIHIITNPVAGRGRSCEYLDILIKLLEKNGIKCKPLVTEHAKQAYEIAKDICLNVAHNQCSGIVGIGGDGTIQEIVAGMAAAYDNAKVAIPLGIFPGGSGNDFAMALEGGKKVYRKKYRKNMTDIAESLVAKIVRNSTRTIDLILANDEAYLVAANVGIDARIVHAAVDLKPKLGGSAYLAAVYKCIMRHRNINLEICIDGEKIPQRDYTLIAVCNNRTYGGGLCIAPPAKFDDGKITVCLVEGMGRLKLGMLFPSILVEKHVHIKPVKIVECKKFSMTVPSGTETLCLDGNLSPAQGTISFEILPQVLDVFA